MQGRIFFVLYFILIAACSHPRISLWEKHSDHMRQSRFVYQLPERSKWQLAQQIRVIKNKREIPEKIYAVRGERAYDFSERFRELFLEEKIDPVDFLAELKASDEVICQDVDFSIIKKIDSGFIYRERAKHCRDYPDRFVTYGKIATIENGLLNLQYQAVPSKVTQAAMNRMYYVVQQAKPVSH